MNAYSVIFSDEAEADLISSVQWGYYNWGEMQTWKWYRETRDRTEQVLGAIPLAQPIAPENDEYTMEVRQMLFGRYRVIFNVKGKEVRILHVRGPFTGEHD